LVTTLVVREMLSTSTPTELMADCRESCKHEATTAEHGRQSLNC
jgi:hypothetical protein